MRYVLKYMYYQFHKIGFDELYSNVINIQISLHLTMVVFFFFYLASFRVSLDLKHTVYSLRRSTSLNSIAHTSCQSANLILTIEGGTVVFEGIQCML